MDTTTLLLIAAGAYLLLQQPRTRAPLSRPAPGTFESGPGGTAIQLPGLGSFRSGPGGTTAVIDPNFISRLFPPNPGPASVFQPGSISGGFGGLIGGGIGGVPLPSTVPIATPLPPTAPPGPIWEQVPTAPSEQLMPHPTSPIWPDGGAAPIGFEPAPPLTDDWFAPFEPSPLPFDPCVADPFMCSFGSDWWMLG